MKQLSLILFSLFSFILLQAQKIPTAGLYGFGQWDSDSLGNHRVVLSVDKAADAVLATMDWRRKDLDPAGKDLIVVDAATGQRITNVTRFNINREQGEIVFQPRTIPGEYYVYYLKNTRSGSRYYPTVHYPPFEETAAPDWLKKTGSPVHVHPLYLLLKSYNTRRSGICIVFILWKLLRLRARKQHFLKNIHPILLSFLRKTANFRSG